MACQPVAPYKKTPERPVEALSFSTRAGSCFSPWSAGVGRPAGRRRFFASGTAEIASPRSAPSASLPVGQRFNLYWSLYSHNIRSAEVLRFLKELRRHLPRGFILIWDRGRPHRAKHVQLWLADRKRIDVEWLPPYAPDLNPVECLWSRTKYGDLANFAPDTLSTLEHAVAASLCRTRSRRDLFRGFFQGAELTL